jgi:transcriptional regulator with XRE-family HTH domain
MPAHDLLQSIAMNLRKLRAQRGVTREQLGMTAEVDPQLIKRIESGRANPALVVLSRLASALTISASLVLSGGDVAALESNPPAAVEPFEGDAVGETLVSLRKQRHLSRRALAQKADVQAGTLANYETAATDARILTIEPIAGALGLEAADFVRLVELRQRQLGAGRGWQSPAAGVLFRVVASGANSRLWEWRLAPHTEYQENAAVAVEEIATAIRGRVRVELGDEVHHLHRGRSIVLTPSVQPRFANAGTSTARLLRYRSVTD